jgi:SAM-dependent methyltransferase
VWSLRSRISERVWRILSCPYCTAPLRQQENGAACTGCGEEFRYTKSGQLDLRLHKGKLVQVKVVINDRLAGQNLDFTVLHKKSNPEVNFNGLRIPQHLDEKILSYFPKAKGKDSLVLDLGCGKAIHREVCERAGFEYVGLDINSDEADILGDAHALPFADNSFEFIISIAVLEHTKYPALVMREARRVLHPGREMIGTVAFLEPFHGSFNHLSHLGVATTLESADFSIEQIAPSCEWSVLTANASMSLFPRLPPSISRLLVLPLYFLHRAWWKIGYLLTRHEKATEQYRVLSTTGTFAFIVRKPS